jgi:LPXTG-motif cell wall-anchored protein
MWRYADQGIAEGAMRSGSDQPWWELHGYHILILIAVIAGAALVATLFVIRRRRRRNTAERIL